MIKRLRACIESVAVRLIIHRVERRRERELREQGPRETNQRWHPSLLLSRHKHGQSKVFLRQRESLVAFACRVPSTVRPGSLAALTSEPKVVYIFPMPYTGKVFQRFFFPSYK